MVLGSFGKKGVLPAMKNKLSKVFAGRYRYI